MDDLEDSLQYYNYPLLDGKKLSANNGTERTNAEIQRRNRVVGCPSFEPYLRLLVCYLMEYEDATKAVGAMKTEAITEQRWLRQVT